MAKPIYTVVVNEDGAFSIQKVKDVAYLETKGTSLVKAQRILKGLQDA